MAQLNPSQAPGEGRPVHEPLAGDPARQAIDSILGYDYQIWRTVEAWLRLPPGQTLYIECAEDYEAVSDAGAVATQVKNSPSNVTLNSEDVRDAIRNFWELRRRNTGRGHLSMRFLTRGSIGKEKGAQLGSERGLDLWGRAAGGDHVAGQLVANHLLAQGGKEDFVRFLRESTPEQMRDELFSRIEWATEEPSIEAARLSVSRLAVNLGSRRSTPPSVSARAVPALLERCRQAATQTEAELRSLTIEDAELCFETNTTLPVPISNALVSALGAGSGGALTFAPASFDGELPDLPVNGLPRSEFVAELVDFARTQGAVLIVGTEGEGKSTAANMLARALGGGCYWMDLRGGDEPVSIAAVENALVLARSAHPPALIVLDDLPAAQGVPDAIWGRLAVLIGAARRAGVALAMTSRGVPADMVDPRFKAFGTPVAPVPRISEQEMVQYFLGLGCPTENRAQTWARMTLAHSGNGHPKLVHLAALELRDRGWEAAGAADLLSPPRSVEEARAHARQAATKSLPPADRDLLFALSLSISAFERPLAIDFGSRLGLLEPGAAFDRLVGRWLERQGAAGYKATPLLNGQAKELWPADRLRRTHAHFLDAHMAGRSLRVDQAMDLFLHAFQAQDPSRFAMFVSAVSSNIDKAPSLAEALEVLVAVGDADDVPAIPFNEHCSLLFRFLQFRIAKARRPEAVADIARRWLLEIDRFKERDLAEAMRAMRGVAVASAADASLSTATIAQALRDAAGVEKLGIQFPTTSALELGVDAPEPSRELDSMQLLFLVAQASVETLGSAAEMLDELERFEPALRTRFLESFSSPLAREGFSMFDRALVGLNRMAGGADWSAFAHLLRRAKDLGIAWGAASFAAAAARVLSIVLDEHLGDKAAAAAVLDGPTAPDTAPALQEQMANLAFRAQDYSKALGLWERSLLGGAQSGQAGVRDPFAMRKAGIAASKLGHLKRAAEWFERAAELTFGKVKVFPPAPFHIDACYCWLKAGEGKSAVLAAARARAEVRQPVDPEEAPRLFAAQKLLGQVLLWACRDLDGEGAMDEPLVGMASDPDLNLDAIGSLPPTPSDIIDMALVEVARALDFDDPLLADSERALSQTKHPLVAMRFRADNLRAHLLRGAHSGAAVEIHHLNDAFLGLRAMHRRGDTQLVEFNEEIDEAARVSEPGVAVNCVLQALALASMRRANLSDLVGIWCTSLAHVPSGGFLIAIIEAAAPAFSPKSGAMDLVRRSPDPIKRVGAAASVLAEDVRGALETAQSQWVLIGSLLDTPARGSMRLPLEAFCELFAKQWQRLAQSPALLSLPRISGPLLQAAIEAEVPPSRKLLALAQAGEAAAGSTMPATILAVLRELVESERVREDRLGEFRASAAS